MKQTVIEHLLSRGEQNPVNILNGGPRLIYEYDLRHREDFVTYIETSDILDGSRTWFAHLMLNQINDMRTDLKLPGGYGHCRLGHMIGTLFLTAPELRLSRENLHDFKSFRKLGVHARGGAQTLYTLHQLQHEELFTFPVSAVLTPDGTCAISTGNTRLVFEKVREETLPVMLVDYRHPNEDDIDASVWCKARDFDIGCPWDDIRMRSMVFSPQLNRFCGYVNHSRYLKFMYDHKRHEQFASLSGQDEDVTFEAELLSDGQLLVDDKQLCYKLNNRWRMTPR